MEDNHTSEAAPNLKSILKTPKKEAEKTTKDTDDHISNTSGYDSSNSNISIRLQKVKETSKEEENYRKRTSAKNKQHNNVDTTNDDNNRGDNVTGDNKTGDNTAVHDTTNHGVTFRDDTTIEWPKSISEESLSSCKTFFEKWRSVAKVFFTIFLFSLVMASLLISKGCLLFITSQMNPYVGFQTYGQRFNQTSSNWTEGSCGVPECKKMSSTDGGHCVQKESVRWIWAMYLCQCVPYVIMFSRSLWKMCFKKKIAPSMSTFLAIFTTESVHSIGMFWLLYTILPIMDVSRVLFIMPGIAFVPSVLALFNPIKNQSSMGYKILDTLAIVVQFSAMSVWIVTTLLDPVGLHDIESGNIEDLCINNFSQPAPSIISNSNYIMSFQENEPTPPIKWTLPVGYRLPEVSNLWKLFLALFFISVGYWENFIDIKSNGHGRLGEILIQLKKDHNESHTKTYLFISIWKILLTFLLLILHHSTNQTPIDLDTLLNSSYFYDNVGSCGAHQDNSFYSDWLDVSAIQIVMGIVCFCAADMAIQTHLQIAAFTIPLILSTPLAYILLLWACQSCNNTWDFGTDYFWNCFSGHDSYEEVFLQRYEYIGFFWWLSLLWVTRYLWFPENERLTMIDKIFTCPVSCGALLEQSLMLIRRRNDEEISKSNTEIKEEFLMLKGSKLSEGHVPTMKSEKLGIPFIYMCATMWHETEEEMLLMLQSIFRMNVDQCARFGEKYIYNINDSDYYEFEAHIYFDNAFNPHGKDDDSMYTTNEYVKTFIKCINKAASKAYKVQVEMPGPKKYTTPYGGRLEWTLPIGSNKIIVHLKDKQKIRHKKRWSQVMYMNSLIGRGIFNQKMPTKAKEYVADNTYILALDGDIDFQPQAVLHLLDLMKRNNKVSAACGRIHPTGSGPVVWYQKFEYSISHWLQKSTEHVFGCVLCSPGCFSLYRASALMDANIVNEYSKQAIEPLEFVQYDQGEDRWLCTLLIQQGHRIEYSAASDAYTNAPEDFNEFFNQRRRWITSTFANILDLLRHGRSIAKKNESVSLLYMAYQALLFIASILGPGTIFLLICGSFQVVWGVSPFLSFFIAIIPLVIFVLLCYFTKTETQLFYALILSGAFAIIQMIVLAGILRVVVDEGICSSSAIFMIFTLGIFVVAALVHPIEFFNLVHLFFFYLCIPCTYLLLIIYSICNVNQVSWGTREVKQNVAKQKKGFMARYFNIEMNEDEDDNDGCCTCLPFCNQNHKEDNETMEIITDKTTDKKSKSKKRKTTRNSVDQLQTEIPTISSVVSLSSVEETPPCPWYTDIGDGPVHQLSTNENNFWEAQVSTVLSPETTTTKQAEIKIGLNKLRNKAVCCFLMIDILLMVFVLSLKMSIGDNEDGLVFNYTCGISDDKYYTVDPIGFTFIIVFGLLMVMQFIGMLLHRVFTLLQLMATTVLCRSNKIVPKLTSNDFQHTGRSYEFAIQMQRMDLDGDDDDDNGDNDSVRSFTDDTHHKKKVTTERKTYVPEEMKRIVEARDAVLKERLNQKVDKQADEHRPSISKRKSIFQPVIDVMVQKKTSVTVPNDKETHLKPDMDKQGRVVDKIITKT